MEFTHAHSARAGPGAKKMSHLHAADPEQPCASLNKLARYIRLRGMDWNARRVAQALCEYFDRECRRHRQEQERGLISALRQQVRDQQAAHIEGLLSQWQEQQQAIAAAWERLRDILSDIAFCRPASLSAEDAARFATLYRQLVDFEQQKLRPLMQQMAGTNGTHVSSQLTTQ